MSNNLGKTLVLVHFVLSLMCLAFALTIFFSEVDWGKKEAARAWLETKDSKIPNERIPAEIDKRVALLERLMAERLRAMIRVKEATVPYQEAEGKFASNHVVYTGLLDMLERGQGKIRVHPLQYDAKGKLLLVQNKPWGLPAFAKQPLPGVDKSYTVYFAELAAKMKDMQERSATIKKWFDDTAVMTIRMNGKRDMDKLLEPGYYQLLEGEAQAQAKMRDEIVQLQPLWVRELYNAQLLCTRRFGLEARLKELGVDPSVVLQQYLGGN